jgi:DNA-binding GntR family transcriptional regulator
MTSLPAPQLQQVSLRDQALAVIRQGLIMGEIIPGEIYSASSMAAKLGVSSSPVREAMLTLVNQGVMEAVRNRGFRVVPLSPRDIQNVYDLRLLLEVPSMGRVAAGGLAVGRREEFAELADQITASSRERNMVGYLEYDRQFHLGLLDLLENPRLTAIVENLRDQTRLLGLKELSERGLLIASAEEHRPILDAAIAGDRDLTERLMTGHLEHIRSDWSGDSPS